MFLKLLKIFSLSCLSLILVTSIFAPVLVSAQSSGNRYVPSKSQICGGACPVIDSEFVPTSDGIFRFIIFFARFLTYVGVALAVLFFVFAGLQFIVGQSENAKQNLITTFIGLIVIIVAYTIVNIIAQTLANGDFGVIFE
jgi:hypothetical protein